MQGPDTIPSRQNAPANLELVAAASKSYALGKMFWYVQILLVLTSATVGPVVATLWPTQRVWIALAAVAISLLDLIVLEPLIAAFRTCGAKIQEEFDCKVLDLKRDPFATGKTPSHEAIIRLARWYRRSDPEGKDIRNWYPPITGEIKVELGRLVCQRANTAWDASLRREVCFIIAGTVTLVVFGGVVTAVGFQMTTEAWLLSLVVPILPLFVRGWKECSAHKTFAEHSNNLRRYVDELWPDAINGGDSSQRLSSEARGIQTQLFRRRAAAPFVPTRYFKLRHDDHEHEMLQAAAKLVEEAKAASEASDAP